MVWPPWCRHDPLFNAELLSSKFTIPFPFFFFCKHVTLAGSSLSSVVTFSCPYICLSWIYHPLCILCLGKASYLKMWSILNETSDPSPEKNISCFARNTVLRGLPFGGVPVVLVLDFLVFLVCVKKLFSNKHLFKYKRKPEKVLSMRPQCATMTFLVISRCSWSSSVWSGRSFGTMGV